MHSPLNAFKRRWHGEPAQDSNDGYSLEAAGRPGREQALSYGMYVPRAAAVHMDRFRTRNYARFEQKNNVDRRSILSGQDVRTTVS